MFFFFNDDYGKIDVDRRWGGLHTSKWWIFAELKEMGQRDAVVAYRRIAVYFLADK